MYFKKKKTYIVLFKFKLKIFNYHISESIYYIYYLRRDLENISIITIILVLIKILILEKCDRIENSRDR